MANEEPRILAIGITGRVGFWLPDLLAESGASVRALVRDPDAARVRLGSSAALVDLVHGDVTDRESLARALRGIDRVYIGLTTGNPDDEIPVFDSVAEAGVERVVKISGLRASPDCVIAMGISHYRVESHLQRLGLTSTAIRPTLSMDNLIGEAAQGIASGYLTSIAGNSRVSWVHPRDVARVAAVALTESGHEGRVYECTGPESLTYRDVAEALGRGLDLPVAVRPVSDETYSQELAAKGFDPWAIEHLVSMYRDAVRTGYFDLVTDDIEAATGQRPVSITTWIEEHADALRPKARL